MELEDQMDSSVKYMPVCQEMGCKYFIEGICTVGTPGITSDDPEEFKTCPYSQEHEEYNRLSN